MIDRRSFYRTLVLVVWCTAFSCIRTTPPGAGSTDAQVDARVFDADSSRDLNTPRDRLDLPFVTDVRSDNGGPNVDLRPGDLTPSVDQHAAPDSTFSCPSGTWCQRPLAGITVDLHAVLCIGLNQYLVVGDQGTILRVDQSGWSSMNSGTTYDLFGIGGSGEQGAVAVGAHGAILALQNGQWGSMNSGTSEDLSAVWGGLAGAAYAVGENSTVLGLGSGGWAPVATGANGTFWAVTSAQNYVFLAGNGGTLWRNHVFSGWEAMDSGTAKTLRGIWASSSSDIVAVGSDGTIISRNIASGDLEPQNPVTLDHLWGVWGADKDTVYAVGKGGTILLGSTTGNWTPMSSGTTAALHGVAGCSRDHITVVGENGTLLQKMNP